MPAPNIPLTDVACPRVPLPASLLAGWRGWRVFLESDDPTFLAMEFGGDHRLVVAHVSYEEFIDLLINAIEED